MTTPREEALADLRQSIDMLPERTRLAMLSGLGSNTVITGAFTDGSGVCPMLAAHREGDRTRCMGFPEAWDRFTGVHGRGICRPATQYEVLQLRMQVEESLDARQDSNGFAEAIAEHQASVEARHQRSRRISGGFVADLTSAIEEHRSAARERRGREASDVGLDWLFEETLVLPEDFGAVPATEPEQVEAEEFDFTRY
ncbi:MAG: hypothetical protein QOJ89_336 [bacterium]|jgi:hypothetical protein